MGLMVSQIVGVAALVPALQFGQVPDVLDVSKATKDAFQSASKAFDSIEAQTKEASKNDRKKNSSTAKSKTRRGNASKRQDEAPTTIFSKIGERANDPKAGNGATYKAAALEQEKQVLDFLGQSSSWAYRIALSLVGFGVACCVGVRIKERVKDFTTGRPSLAKSRIVRR